MADQARARQWCKDDRNAEAKIKTPLSLFTRLSRNRINASHKWNSIRNFSTFLDEMDSSRELQGTIEEDSKLITILNVRIEKKRIIWRTFFILYIFFFQKVLNVLRIIVTYKTNRFYNYQKTNYWFRYILFVRVQPRFVSNATNLTIIFIL